MPFPATPLQEFDEQRKARVLNALDDHSLTEVVAAAADLSMLQTLRILQDLKERGLVEQYGVDCWGKR